MCSDLREVHRLDDELDAMRRNVHRGEVMILNPFIKGWAEIQLHDKFSCAIDTRKRYYTEKQ